MIVGICVTDEALISEKAVVKDVEDDVGRGVPEPVTTPVTELVADKMLLGIAIVMTVLI